MKRDVALAAGTVTGAAAFWALEGRWMAALLVLTVLLLRRRRVALAAPVKRKRRTWSDEERRFILDRDGWACVYCGSRDELEIDHIVPFSRGGACSADNAQVLCGPCNRAKGAS